MSAPAASAGEPPFLLDVKRAAALCSMSVDTFERLVAAGALPRPLDLPVRKRLWHRDVLNEALRKRAPGNDDKRAGRRDWEFARPKGRAAAHG